MGLKKYTLLFFSFLFLAQATSQEKLPPLEVEVSVPGGFYDDPVEVTLSCGGARIYFTTDGKKPVAGASSQLYRRPVRMEKTGVIRFMAVKGDQKSPILSHTYFIREPHTQLPVVSLSIDPEILFDPINGLFVAGNQVIDSVWQKPGANFWSHSEVGMNTEIFIPDGTCVFRSGAGLRLFGGMSRLFPQKSLSIVARDKYGQNRIDYPIFGPAGLKKFKFLVLRNGGSDFNKAHCRDCILTSMVEGWDMDKQDCQPAQVYINGQYWGLYNIREKINRYFIAGHHDVDKDSLELLEHRYTRRKGSRQHYLDLLQYIERYDLSDPQHYAYVQSRMDVDNFMNYQIAQIYADNQDAGGNIRYWRPQTPDGRWRWILYDTDWGLGLHSEDAFTFNSLAFHTEPNGPAWPNPSWSTLILRKLLENENFKTAFINRFADHLNGSFSAFQAEAVVERYYQMLYPEMPRHLERWNLSQQRWNDEMAEIRAFVRQRPEYLRAFLIERFNLGRERDLYLEVDPGGRVVINNNLEVTGRDFQGIYFANLPIQLEAVPNLGYRFSHWEGLQDEETERWAELKLDRPQFDIRAVFERYDHPLAGKVVINEVSCNNRNSGDWVEIYNGSSKEVDLSGWLLTDSKNRFIIPELLLPPKSYAVLCEKADEFAKAFPDAYRYVGDWGFGLNKRREKLALFTAQGALVDSLAYDVPPADTLFTLNLLLPSLDNADPENWELVVGSGSPNAANRYYLESTLRGRQVHWMEIGTAVGVILLCLILLALRHRRII